MKLNNPERFANEFISEYLRISFGSLSKKELELLIFKLILIDQGLYLDFDKFKVSKLLKVSETKVSNLYKELQLRGETFNDEWFTKELKRLFKDLKVEVDSKRVILQVANPILKFYMEKFFNEKGIIVDYSFNKNILKINLEAFSELLLNEYLTEEEKREVLSSLNKNELEFKEIIKNGIISFVNGFSEEAGRKLAGIGSILFANGVTSLINFLKTSVMG